MRKRSITQTGISRFAKSVVDLATGNPINEDVSPIAKKNPAGDALGKLGGLKSDKARAEKLSNRKQRETAKKSA